MFLTRISVFSESGRRGGPAVYRNEKSTQTLFESVVELSRAVDAPRRFVSADVSEKFKIWTNQVEENFRSHAFLDDMTRVLDEMRGGMKVFARRLTESLQQCAHCRTQHWILLEDQRWRRTQMAIQTEAKAADLAWSEQGRRGVSVASVELATSSGGSATWMGERNPQNGRRAVGDLWPSQVAT